LSLVDTGSYDVQQFTSDVITIDSENTQDCGPQTFSSSVKSAFKRESDLSQYSSSQLYLAKEWVIVFKKPYCSYEITEIIDIQHIDSYNNFEILSGTWIVQFQTGDLAIKYINELVDDNYIWNFYPLIDKDVNLRYEPNDPYYESGDQWYLDNEGQNAGLSGIDLNTQGAWNDYTGDGIVIGVVDDGIDYNHPDISPNFLSQYSYDYCGNDTDVMPVDSFDDGIDEVDWHGTAVAGIVAGKGDNNLGITGVAYNASIVGLRLVAGDCEYEYNDEHTLNDLAISETLVHEIEKIDIYTNSWGPPDSGFRLGGAGPLSIASIEYGIAEGRDGLGSIYTWANGNGLDDNDQSNKDGFANSRYTIAVGSVDWQGEQTAYSETGSNMLVSAPSNSGYWGDPAVFTTDVSGSEGESSTDYTSNMGGTSSATPMVAGVVALMLEANQNLTWRDVQHILVKTSRQVDTNHPGWFQTKVGNWYNHAYGYGLVDATAAVNMAKTWESVGSELTVNTGEIAVDEYIPDNNDNGISSIVIVNQSINIENVEVMVDIWHDWRGDLSLFLTSPSGVTSELVRSHGDSGDHYDNWIFTSVVHWDENSFGEWALKVNDTDSSYTGEFRSWNLTFYGTEGADDDQDGLSNYAEYFIGTGPANPDFDADGLLDGEEFYGWSDYYGTVHRTDPKNSDTDQDTAGDWIEGLGFNETGFVTDPNNNDTDADGLWDGHELYGYFGYFTNPTSQDTDNDTLSDYEEINAWDLYNRSSSDPTKLDTDNDTMPDPYEIEHGFDPGKQIDGWLDADYDGFDVNGDGLTEDEYYTNAEEYARGTNPRFSDSDLCEDGSSCPDGMYDGWEVHWGLDPLTPDSNLDFDNDTLSNLLEYDNSLVETRLFSLNEPTLRAYWKLDGTDPFTALDMTTNSNIGISKNNPIRTPSQFGNGVYCDGIDDYVEFDSLHNSKFSDYTVTAWVKLTNYTDNFATVFGTSNDGRTWLGVNSDDFFEFKVASGNTLYSSITNYSVKAELGVWYSLAATYSESQDSIKFYVNGTLISEVGISPGHVIKTAGDNNYMCRGQNGEYLNGTIDNIAIWERALNPDEIQYVYGRPLGFGNYYTFKTDDGILSTNPSSNDTDGDGLSDSEESYLGFDGYITDPTNVDTDDDGLNDSYEALIYKTDPTKDDTDGDNHTDNYLFYMDNVTGFRINQTGDAFPLDDLEWNDTDGDGVGDNSDAFPFDSNETLDSDRDMIGDNAENVAGTDPQNNDTDSDGVNDFDDMFPLDSNETIDTDGDGVGDNSDACPEYSLDFIDSDSDGYCDRNDAFPNNPNEWIDSDSDGYGDNSDAFPDNPNKSVEPEKTEFVQEKTNYSLDSIMLAIVGFGAVYFVFKYFVKY